MACSLEDEEDILFVYYEDAMKDPHTTNVHALFTNEYLKWPLCN